MKIDRTKLNIMPLILGPVRDLEDLPGNNYASVESLMITFETNPDAIPPLLPEPFKPGKEPNVTVMVADNNGVDFLAGGGYRLAVVAVAAQFDGQDGHLEGNYVLCMPENKTLPIILGREQLGMPKFFSDISSIKVMDDGHLRCEVSLWGHLLFGFDVAPPLKNQNAIIRKAASSLATKSPSFGYKYIPSLKGPPDADYPTVMWTDNNIDHLEVGKNGEFFLGDPSEKDIGEFKPLLDVLKTLPVRKVIQTSYSKGSMVLRTDKNGRIQ
jgi:acetoacetate decarboxylase